MPAWLLVALGSACGGVARWLLASWVDGRVAGGWWGTFSVNVLGGLLIGACAAVLQRDAALWWLLITGVLGGFTTFSSYSLQTLQLMQKGQVAVALAYALGSVVACLLACWAGWSLARLVSASGP
jgi:CrcB protein